MRLKVMLPVFSSVFLAELGDKTQIATLSFSAGGAAAPAEVFLAASAALLASTALAIAFGAALGRRLPPAVVTAAAGLIFLVLGGYYLFLAGRLLGV